MIHMEVKRLGGGWWLVKGRYVVNSSKMSCTCVYFSLFQKPCKHIKYVLSREKNVKEVKK